MNFAILERMIMQGDLSRSAFRYLLECRGECEWLDYKEQLHIEHDAELCAFTRDALALKNVGGGYILAGVRDKTWEQIGLDTEFPYDSKQLRDKINKAGGVYLDADIVTHTLDYDGKAKKFALILVRSSKKRSKRRTPTVAAKDFCPTMPYGIRRGDIYVRRGDSTVKISTQAELEELLEKLEENTYEDSSRTEDSPSPFAVEDGTYRLLDRGFECFVGRHELRERILEAILGDPRIWIINVHGPGGVGKSAIVNWAAYELYSQKKFEAILHLTAKETILTEAGISRFNRCLYSLENLLDHILMLFEENTDIEFQSKKKLAIELLSAWKTLIILDNMETVSDGRILTFIQTLPPDSKARIVLTSRTKSGGWELPIPVTELSKDETLDFIKYKSNEIKVDFPLDTATIESVYNASGGLPLATQWILGQYKLTRRIDIVLDNVKGKDSPVLEFSFRNIWNMLSADAKTVIAVMSIFDGPVSVQQIAIASEMNNDNVERAFSELVDVTLVNRTVQQSDGRILYNSLPITLAFSRNELSEMSDLEVRARQRLNRFNEQMELQSSEVVRFQGDFERYGIDTPNEKRAAILCRRAESEMFSGNAEGAELLFRQAKDLAPQSSYILAKYALYELARNRIGLAMERVNEACNRADRKTGSLCYGAKARILDVQHDRSGRVEALKQATTFDPDDLVLRHQYGVALSRNGREAEAIDQFNIIISSEEHRLPPRETLVMALTTRIINLQRIGKTDDARADYARAMDIIKQYPHLAHAASRLPEFEA